MKTQVGKNTMTMYFLMIRNRRETLRFWSWLTSGRRRVQHDYYMCYKHALIKYKIVNHIGTFVKPRYLVHFLKKYKYLDFCL
jgi:hypothetical protein